MQTWQWFMPNSKTSNDGFSLQSKNILLEKIINYHPFKKSSSVILILFFSLSFYSTHN